MDGWMDGRTDGRMDRQADRYIDQTNRLKRLTLNFIVFKHLYSASSGVNRSEALSVCKAS